jgi:hypothetical protein
LVSIHDGNLFAPFEVLIYPTAGSSSLVLVDNLPQLTLRGFNIKTTRSNNNHIRFEINEFLVFNCKPLLKQG